MKDRGKIAEESRQPMRWWYLSFSDDSRGGFLGAAIVEARGETLAVAEASVRGINHGGQVMMMEIPADALSMFPERLRNRLLDMETVIRELGGTIATST